MSEASIFLVHTDLRYGAGTSVALGDFLKDKNYRDVLVLVDENVARGAYYRTVAEGIEAAAASMHVEYLRGTEEPDYDYLDQVTNKVRLIEKIDVLIGIGGGSCLDIAKAVAALRTNPGRGIEYRGFDRVIRPSVPTIAIPTTAGTGSEVTINAVFTDKNEKRKLGINGRHMHAAHAVLDAEWTIDCPRSVAVSAGVDALTHALESFMCRKATLLTRAFSKEAFQILFSGLPSLIEDPENRERRQRLLFGSYLAGIALFNSGSGIAGAFSYPLGVHFKIPHGLAGGIFLPSVLEFNVSKGYEDYALLFDLVEPDSGLSLKEKSVSFCVAVQALFDKLGVPQYLDEWGITRTNVREVASLLRPLQAAFDQNPVPFDAEQNAYDLLLQHVRSR